MPLDWEFVKNGYLKGHRFNGLNGFTQILFAKIGLS